jgi:pSer/pThr/pTyr-binding forkhead associated (FHA) protein
VGRAPVVIEVNGERHPVTEAGLVLGRGDEADLRINDPGISRRHAEIQISSEDGRMTVSVVDLGSTNGTSVDGRRVQQALLHDGARIVLGATTVIVRDPHRKGP